VVSCAKDSIRALDQAHGPLVPDFGLRVVAPNTDFYSLALSGHEGSSDGEVEGEPRVHAGGVSFRLDAVVNLLVQLGSEVSSESVDLLLSLLARERDAGVLFEGLVFSLREVLHAWIVGVGQVSESEHFFGGSSTRISSTVDSHDVG